MEMKRIVIGILAHVDAGKTTLSEGMLYLSGQIKKHGRVDHGNTFLDFHNQERDRGITIYSKQARLIWKDIEIIFIDTPGHVDFSIEMERALQVLDYAIVVVSGLDGVQTHTETIWKLLSHYRIPSFLFINKMDITSLSQEELMFDIKQKLDEKCLSFQDMNQELYETIALINDEALDEYLKNQELSCKTLSSFIFKRHIFPVFFGSALHLDGLENFMNKISEYCLERDYHEQFGAIVYKITHDHHQQKLVHIRMTGGSLKVKDKIGDEKIDQIRIYSGSKFDTVSKVDAGEVCVLTGLKKIQLGEGLGIEKKQSELVLSSYIHYRVVLPEHCDAHKMFKNLQQLSEEDPSLHVTYHHQLNEIRIQLMGEIQTEILKNIIKERFQIDVEFDQGEILYKETILDTVEGVGHFEPLRHYAEVHILLEPLQQGSGLVFENRCSRDVLDEHWQNLILTHLKEKEHIGVLIGAPITDMKITLIAGKAHQKHTEGGDFRQATYRAVRQGLKYAQSILLEPYYQYELILPRECLGRALYDLEAMKSTFEIDDSKENVVITGEAPVSLMYHYHLDVISYSKGKGHLYCTLNGYKPCHNQEEIIQQRQYDSEADLENPTGSLFCSHGAGFYVKWDEVKNYMHLPLQQTKRMQHSSSYSYRSSLNEDDELEEIFTRTYGPIKRKDMNQSKEHQQEKKIIKKSKPQCLLVDGYNVIHAWLELKELAKDNLDGARLRLMDMMCSYQGYKNCLLILVFDAYKVKGNIGVAWQYHNIYVVYTKEAQTADMYIERAVHTMAEEYTITVATSDALEQLIVTGAGAYRMSSRELKLDYEYMNHYQQEEYKRQQGQGHTYLLEDVKNYKEK